MPNTGHSSTTYNNTTPTSLPKKTSFHSCSQPYTTSTNRKLLIEIQNQDQAPTPKISDFGFAAHFQHQSQPILFTEFKGTRKGYMAPQIHQTQTPKPTPYHAPNADVFALGVILFALFFQKLPFEYARPDNKLYKLIIQKKYQDFWNFHSQMQQLSLQQHFRAEQFKDLFQRMVSLDAKERPTVEEILKDAWII